MSRCYYGHLHGGSHRLAFSGRLGTVEYHLVAADYIGFQPKKSWISEKFLGKNEIWAGQTGLYLVKYRLESIRRGG